MKLKGVKNERNGNGKVSHKVGAGVPRRHNPVIENDKFCILGQPSRPVQSTGWTECQSAVYDWERTTRKPPP